MHFRRAFWCRRLTSARELHAPGFRSLLLSVKIRSLEQVAGLCPDEGGWAQLGRTECAGRPAPCRVIEGLATRDR
jgi:hypothetical protein